MFNLCCGQIFGILKHVLRGASNMLECNILGLEVCRYIGEGERRLKTGAVQGHSGDAWTSYRGDAGCTW